MRGFQPRINARTTQVGLGALAVGAAVVLAACGSSSSSSSSQPRASGTSGSNTSASASSSPGTMFGTANISGLGTVLVDGRGRTVYILTSGGHTNVPCPDSNGCTKVWPDLPLPSGVSAAKAGNGVQASLLGTMKLPDGQTYPTYNGWLLYEFAADSGSGQANGQGKMTFGGTWYVLNPSGSPVTASASSSSSGGGGGGY